MRTFFHKAHVAAKIRVYSLVLKLFEQMLLQKSCFKDSLRQNAMAVYLLTVTIYNVSYNVYCCKLKFLLSRRSAVLALSSFAYRL